MRFAVCRFAAIVLVVSSFPALAASLPITKLEARRLPAQQVTRRVLDQLSDPLKLQKYPASSVQPTRPLTDLWFWTRARSTYISGLCSADEVTVYFRGKSGPAENVRSEMTAAGIQARTVYRFLAEPQSFDPSILDAAARWKADKACARLSPEKEGFFAAADEEMAAKGSWLIQSAMRETRGDQPLSFECKFEDMPQGCRQSLADVKANTLWQFSSCLDEALARDEQCIEALQRDATGLDAKVIFNFGRGKILRVDLFETVTTSDPRAD